MEQKGYWDAWELLVLMNTLSTAEERCPGGCQPKRLKYEVANPHSQPSHIIVCGDTKNCARNSFQDHLMESELGMGCLCLSIVSHLSVQPSMVHMTSDDCRAAGDSRCPVLCM